ncbi:hypothetical protein [Kitasatospora indigofera]|uniref:hypothetical protein n=1 Tax=Kitasatospora indigofera TaxID=67307 RepID=UPI0033A583EF
MPAGTTATTVAPVAPAVAAGAARAAPTPPPPPAKPQPDPKFRRAVDAAFDTTLLVDELLEVTNAGVRPAGGGAAPVASGSGARRRPAHRPWPGPLKWSSR